MENLLLWGFYILTFYAFLPGLVSRTFGFRVFKKGRAKNEIALTFDDGPDPVYTSQLLDLLKKYNAKATFFVVGIHAERNPELLRRMHEEGHVIGIHNYVHKSNWFMRPGTVKKQIHRTSEIIKKATGERTVYYRPPWGIVNLFDFSNLGYLQIILWSALFGDWRSRVGSDRLHKRMMKKLRPGEVLLLHDCGATLGADRDAPANMLAALEPFLDAGKQRGYEFITVPEMIGITDRNKSIKPSISWYKRTIVAGWMAWERLFHVLFRIESGGTDSVFHIRVVPYHGKTLHLSDGQTIEDKDEVIELHFDNNKLYHLMTESRSLMHVAIRLIREVEQALPKLAATIAGRKDYERVRGLYGISMINKGAEQFGFSVLELPKGLFDKMTRLYLKFLLRVLHPSGKKRVKDQGGRLSPRIIAMSMEEFHRRYGTADSLKPLWNSVAGYEDNLTSSSRTTISQSTYDNANAAREFTP
ncbi:polysaccharide deacetylase family protein [Paenibacillus mendelii]|uniref:Polysaccharide deacetylase family protein n=1 Tax=Paenibacillus mendelii TaxID=206163 RepID=A0ABV6JB68_9BACL|nr:polysaccharide deacetylase family protein [Paenibacillus mendelii]